MISRILIVSVLFISFAAPASAQSQTTTGDVKAAYLTVYLVFTGLYKGGPALSVTRIPEGMDRCLELAEAHRTQRGWKIPRSSHVPETITASCN